MRQILRLPIRPAALLALAALLLLNACSATTGSGPSLALKQQFAKIQQEQKQQAQQLESIQQQLAQLQQRLLGTPEAAQTATEAVSTDIGQPTLQTEPTVIPASVKMEIAGLADSAASYLAAFSNLAAGRYSVAETGFNNFLRSYPQHQYSANARYWLANAQASQGKLKLAADNLRQVIISAEGQDRAPSAMLMLAKLYQQNQQPEDANQVLQQLRERFPDSHEAQQLIPTTEY